MQSAGRERQGRSQGASGTGMRASAALAMMFRHAATRREGAPEGLACSLRGLVWVREGGGRHFFARRRWGRSASLVAW